MFLGQLLVINTFYDEPNLVNTILKTYGIPIADNFYKTERDIRKPDVTTPSDHKLIYRFFYTGLDTTRFPQTLLHTPHFIKFPIFGEVAKTSRKLLVQKKYFISFLDIE